LYAVVIDSKYVIYNTIPSMALTIGDEYGIEDGLPTVWYFNLTKDEWNTWSCCFKQWLLLSPFSSGEDAKVRK